MISIRTPLTLFVVFLISVPLGLASPRENGPGEPPKREKKEKRDPKEVAEIQNQIDEYTQEMFEAVIRLNWMINLLEEINAAYTPHGPNREKLTQEYNRLVDGFEPLVKAINTAPDPAVWQERAQQETKALSTAAKELQDAIHAVDNLIIENYRSEDWADWNSDEFKELPGAKPYGSKAQKAVEAHYKKNAKWILKGETVRTKDALDLVEEEIEAIEEILKKHDEVFFFTTDPSLQTYIILSEDLRASLPDVKEVLKNFKEFQDAASKEAREDLAASAGLAAEKSKNHFESIEKQAQHFREAFTKINEVLNSAADGNALIWTTDGAADMAGGFRLLISEFDDSIKYMNDSDAKKAQQISEDIRALIHDFSNRLVESLGNPESPFRKAFKARQDEARRLSSEAARVQTLQREIIAYGLEWQAKLQLDLREGRYHLAMKRLKEMQAYLAAAQEIPETMRLPDLRLIISDGGTEDFIERAIEALEAKLNDDLRAALILQEIQMSVLDIRSLGEDCERPNLADRSEAEIEKIQLELSERVFQLQQEKFLQRGQP